MNWIKIDGPKPAEGQLVWITGIGHNGRFYGDAKFIHGKYLMFDHVADRHIHECMDPDYWAEIEPPAA